MTTEDPPAQPRERRAHPRVRTLATAWTLAVAGFAIVLLVTSVWTAHLVRTTTVAAARRAELLAAIDDLGMAVFNFRRVADLELATPGEPSLASQREQLRESAFTTLAEARRLVERAELEAVLALVERDVETYMDEREQLAREHADLSEVVRRVRPTFERVLTSLDAIRAQQVRDLTRANREALDASRASDSVSVAVFALLIVGLVGGLVYVRRFVLSPVLSLHGAIERYRSGDRAARAVPAGPREIGDVARAFNGMSDELDSQREQLLTYLAGVAHDLRNPLSALKMGVHVVSHGPPAAREQTIALLDRQVDRLARMIQDLLDATRIEAGQLRLERRRFDLVHPIREITDLYGPTSPDHPIVIDAPSQPVLIDADPARVEQVVSNLVSNAIKYSPEGGRVLIHLDASEREATIEVTDQGIGIPADEVGRIFAPFHRGAPEVAAGAGLGLSVVRRIVVAHGGTVEVESTLGVGSTFRVRLPREPRESSAREAR